MKATFIFILSLWCLSGFSQADTVINGRHYNTVIKYHNFDYKGEKESSYITVYGTIKDSLRTGKWMYVLPDGNVMATGRYHRDVKVGDWKYRNCDGNYFIVTWNRFRKVKDRIVFKDNREPQLVDYDSNTGINLKINGRHIPTPHTEFVFL